jgi:glycosyltransferase involved in cell wall biosynthesis
MKIIRIATNALAVKSFVFPELDQLMEEKYEIIIISSFNKELSDILARKKIKYYSIPLKRNIHILFDLLVLLKLFFIFKREKPDIVHTITPKAGLLGMTTAKILGIPKRVHDYVGMVQETRTGIKKKILDTTDKITCRYATIVFANSFSLKDKMVNNGIVSANKVHVIHKGSSYGVDLDLFNRDTINPSVLKEVKQEINYSDKNRYILFAGRLVRDKGIEELVDVFCDLEKKYPEIRLLLLGDFEQKLDALSRKTLYEIKHNEKIIFIKWTKKLQYYIALSEMLVHPTYREGFANVLLEAGAMNCPVVCSNATGNIDLIKDKETGLVFNIADKESLKAKMIFALDNFHVMSGYAETLYSIVKKDFSKDEIIRMNLKKYN